MKLLKILYINSLLNKAYFKECMALKIRSVDL